MNDTLTLEELFYSCSYPSVSPEDAAWCARATIKAMVKADSEQKFTYAEIKTFVEQQYGLI